MTPHVVLSEDIHPRARQILEAQALVSVATGTAEADLCRAVADADGLVMRANGRVSEAVLAAAPRLRVVGRHGVGLDNIDVAAARRRGVTVVNTPHANSVSVAEHTVACMLTLLRNLTALDRAVRDGDWPARNRLLGSEVDGRTVGIIGLGNIGRRVARILHRGFGMQVLYTDPVPRPDAEVELGARRVLLPTLLRAADVVTLHLPLTESSRGLIDAAALASMPAHAVLVNVSRGGVVDEAALVDACRSGRLAGAALDVFVEEPLPADHLLTSCDRVLLTPHSAAMTHESSLRMSLVVEDVLAVLEGRAPRHAIARFDEGSPT